MISNNSNILEDLNNPFLDFYYNEIFTDFLKSCDFGPNPINFIDPLGLCSESTIYNEGVTTFSNVHVIPYTPVEGIGIYGSYQTYGNISIEKNDDSSFDMSVTVLTGSVTVASTVGDVEYRGEVNVLVDDNSVLTIPLKYPKEPFAISSNTTMIGTANLSLPPEALNKDFTVELSTTYSVSAVDRKWIQPTFTNELPVFKED